MIKDILDLWFIVVPVIIVLLGAVVWAIARRKKSQFHPPLTAEEQDWVNKHYPSTPTQWHGENSLTEEERRLINDYYKSMPPQNIL